MTRRFRGSGKQAKAGRHKAEMPKRRNAPKATRNRGVAIGQGKVVARLTHERDEALLRETANSEILRLISKSPGDLELVFRTILEHATRICNAKFGVLHLVEGDCFRRTAHYNTPPAYLELMSREPVFRPGPRTGFGRVAATKQFVHITDTAATKLYAERDPVRVAGVEVLGIRTLVVVPMLKGSELIGAIAIFRQEVRPFSDKQIELLQNFASQAVIAIENTRLLNELRESLEQQTATSEVLGVVSSYPGELKPIFQTMLENAVRVCGAKFGVLYLAEGNGFRTVAMHDVPRAFAELREREPVIVPLPEQVLGRIAITKQAIHIADSLEQPPQARAGLTDLAGARTILAVPMLKDDKLIGVVAIYRQEVRPFTEKQIALVQNFAAQAVIAIENARLLNELRESYKVVQQQAGKLEAQSQELVKLNQQLEQRVADQVGEIERMGRLRRFLPPQVADLIVASGTEKQLESHRREITALFCDLRGFTGFSQSADPEDVMALLRDYHAAIGQIIFRYGGTLERFAGDGVMVIFNDPVPVENPALQAVLMALDMRSAIEALIDRWRSLGHDLGFGIGIAHGYATLGTIGFEGRFDYAAIGTVSNVASRLCDEARPGQILISPRVLLAVDKTVTVEPVGEFTLKGIRRPMTAYNVLASSTSKPN